MFNEVKNTRIKKRLSQFELSKKSNITQSNLSQIENGKIFPYQGWRVRIAEALDVKEDYLFPNLKKKNNTKREDDFNE